jgi:hypothetical protein
MWFVGIGLFVLAVILFAISLSQKNKLYQMQATETFTAKSLLESASDVAGEIGAGSFNQITEIKGKSVCENPITSELAQKDCVYYSMRITREYEEDYWDTDAEGRRTRKTRKGSDTVASNVRSTSFYIEDATGKIKVNPDGCLAVTEKVMSKFEPGERRTGRMKIGRFSIDFGGLSPVSGGRRTIGYRYEEEIIPLGRDLYVLGEATDKSGEVQLAKPDDKKKKFIVSVKSEEMLVKSAKSASKGLMIGATVSAVAGTVIIVLNAIGVISG